MGKISREDVNKVGIVYRFLSGVLTGIICLCPLIIIGLAYIDGVKILILIVLTIFVILFFLPFAYTTYRIAKTGYPPTILLWLSSQKETPSTENGGNRKETVSEKETSKKKNEGNMGSNL